MALGTGFVAYWDTSSTSSQGGVWPVTFVGGMSVGVGQGKFADAWLSTSTADRAELTTITTDNSTWTISAWGFNLGASGYRALSTNGLTGATGAYHFLVASGTDELGVWSNSTFYGSGTVLAPASYTGWHHYAATCDGTTVRFYVDGVAAGSAVPVWAGPRGVDMIFGSSYGEGFGDRVSDFGVWGRQLSAVEIAEIYTEGNLGNSLGDLIGPATLEGQWLTVAHTVAASDNNLEGQFASVVHTVAASDNNLEGQWLTVVHTGVAVSKLEGQFASVVHTVPSPVAIVPDIVGTPGVVATFDGSASVGVTYYHWSWVTVPGGSSIANAAIPFPDNGAATPLDMTDNEGLWHFEGNANDTSGNVRNGTVTGASLVAGKVGAQAYQFGVADNVNFGAASNFVSANFSISLWIKGDAAWTPATWDAIAGASNLFTWSQGFGAFWQNATTIRFFVGSYTGNYVDLTVTPANWNHIVFTWDGSTITGYLNGNAVDTDAHSAALTGLGNDFFVSYLGNHGSGEQTIDEVAIWSRAISASEITDIYAAQNGLLAGFGSSSFAFTPDLVGTYTVKLATSATLDTTANCVVTAPSSGGGDPIQGASLQGGGLQGSDADFQGYT